MPPMRDLDCRQRGIITYKQGSQLSFTNVTDRTLFYDYVGLILLLRDTNLRSLKTKSDFKKSVRTDGLTETF
jgi:hypothetical protein